MARQTKYEAHRRRHLFLHRALAELLADFTRCWPPDEHEEYVQYMPILDLIIWSYSQTKNPDTSWLGKEGKVHEKIAIPILPRGLAANKEKENGDIIKLGTIDP